MRLFSRSKSEQPKTINPTPTKKWRYFIWGLVILVVGVVGWVGITGLLALKDITAKNTSDAPSFFKFDGDITPEELQAEGDSRINVLFLGIGGVGHSGGQLSDTIQVVSIDPINKTMAMVSVPRDLYVTQANGSHSKINAVYANGASYCKIKGCPAGVDAGGVAAKDMVSRVLGVPVHFFARIDFTGFKKIVDTLDGIQVYVDKPLSDPFYPDDRTAGYAPLYIPAGLQTFNGDLALKYARSRESTSDFDRARRQQQEVAALREKALKLNVLGNPKKITDILTILGANLRTDMNANDMLRIISLVKEIDSNKTTTAVLDTGADGPLKSLTDPQAGYIIVPKKGLNDFTDVQALVATVFQEPYILKEAAKVAIVDASGKPATGAAVKEKLMGLGYNIVSLTTDKTQTGTTLSNNTDKPFTVSLLKKRFTATVTKSAANSTADVVLTIGSKYQLK